MINLGMFITLVVIALIALFFIIYFIREYIDDTKPDMSGKIILPHQYDTSFGFAVSDWYLKFAWWPCNTLDRGWQCFKWVWRRRIYKKAMLPGPDWHYDQNVISLRVTYK